MKNIVRSLIILTSSAYYAQSHELPILEPTHCELGPQTPLYHKDTVQEANVFVEAVKTLNHKLVESLIGDGYDVNAENSEGYTPLQVAARVNSVIIIKKLIESNAIVDKADSGGWTPLWYAVFGGHVQSVKVLIEAGADVNHAQPDGSTMLMRASIDAQCEIVEILIRADADMNTINKNGKTALSYAIFESEKYIRKIRCIRSLLDGGADVALTRENTDESQPLDELRQAIHENRCHLLKVFIERDTGLLDLRDEDGGIPLHDAVAMSGMTCIKNLIESGANVNAVDNKGVTPLLLASAIGNSKIIRYLIASGADVNRPDKSGRTPLFMASVNGSVDNAKILVGAGALPNYTTLEGASALSGALNAGYTISSEIITFLRAQKINSAREIKFFYYSKDTKAAAQFIPYLRPAEYAWLLLDADRENDQEFLDFLRNEKSKTIT